MNRGTHMGRQKLGTSANQEIESVIVRREIVCGVENLIIEVKTFVRIASLGVSSDHGVEEDEGGRKPGWRAMPYILGNETIERIATYGMAANFMVFLLKVFNLGQVGAANVISIWHGSSNFIPILGAFLADSYLGKFRTIAGASFATLVGIVILTLTAWVPRFHPPPSTSPTTFQLSILMFGLCCMAIGTGGIRPCSIPFAVDQFDTSCAQGRQGVARFYNWYYTTQTLVSLINITLVVYIQNRNWVLGFGLLALLMSCAIILFLAGTRVYSHIPPQGSLLSAIAQVFVAAYSKRRLECPPIPQLEQQEPRVIIYYDPPLKQNTRIKMPLTKQLEWLNKGAVVVQDNEVNAEGLATNSWRLCSIQQVEEVKCLVKLIPIWASGILSTIPMTQQGTFPVSQALKMDRQLGHFQMPAASIGVVALLTIAIWLPCYDLFIQPALAKLTKREQGLTSLHKIVFGNIFAILTMLSAGLVEGRRRTRALHMHAPPMSVFCLAPQFALLGLSEVFIIIGQIEFYNSESPEHMKSIANSLQYLVAAFSTYTGALLMNLVHKFTNKHAATDWLNDDINKGRLDYYYFLVAGLASLNLLYLLFCAKRYRYKATTAKSQVLDTPTTT
ncbi:protein NRT1/ PTR FAMILY 2.13-like [Senna tora]|uniref:Protein NRT1/ PTR FAMILY 2.13-like n=1 Tax=Senna tora TaxID=362788 RepID=A0A834TZJ2_9FABA|nr:protein NRT1/ PTR FAMILY 2.13-like [Senna tora]